MTVVLLLNIHWGYSVRYKRQMNVVHNQSSTKIQKLNLVIDFFRRSIILFSCVTDCLIVNLN
jgi:hypothetical protein